MTLNVDTPDPPSLRDRVAASDDETTWADDPSEGDGRREAIADVLEEGAWHDAFVAWARDTHLTSAAFSVVAEHGLIDRMDVYWDTDVESVDYALPAVDDELVSAVTGDDADEIRSELDDLGAIVAGTVEEYLAREESVFDFSHGDTHPDFRDDE